MKVDLSAEAFARNLCYDFDQIENADGNFELGQQDKEKWTRIIQIANSICKRKSKHTMPNMNLFQRYVLDQRFSEGIHVTSTMVHVGTADFFPENCAAFGKQWIFLSSYRTTV